MAKKARKIPSRQKRVRFKSKMLKIISLAIDMNIIYGYGYEAFELHRKLCQADAVVRNQFKRALK